MTPLQREREFIGVSLLCTKKFSKSFPLSFLGFGSPGIMVGPNVAFKSPCRIKPFPAFFALVAASSRYFQKLLLDSIGADVCGP